MIADIEIMVTARNGSRFVFDETEKTRIRSHYGRAMKVGRDGERDRTLELQQEVETLRREMQQRPTLPPPGDSTE